MSEKKGFHMSGDGVLSVRLPLSLLGTFRVEAERQGISVHEAARRVISFLPSLSQDDLKSLREPPQEVITQKVSLYVGWRVIDFLTVATRNSKLTNSTIVRRVLYALLVTNDLKFVQQNEHWELQIVNGNCREKPNFNSAGKGLSCA